MRPLLPRWCTALFVLLPAYAAGDVRLSVPDVTIGSGSTTATMAVVLDSSEELVAGTQNDITVALPLRFAVAMNGRPDCAVNPAIDKYGTSFAFLGAPCEQSECRIRALVLALDNVDPITVPAELYTCRLSVDEGANVFHPIQLSNAAASDPRGNAIAVETMDGGVYIGGVAERAAFAIGDAAVCGGGRGTVEVTYTSGPTLDSLSHVVQFDARAPIGSDGAGSPRCAPVAPLEAEQATFTFVPDGCTPGTDCSAVRVFLRSGAAPILPREPLYRCDVEPTVAAAVGTYELRCTNARADNRGIPDLTAVCHGGSLIVGECEPTPTPTVTPEQSADPTATSPTSATETPTVRGALGASAGDGGCAIGPAPASGAWPIILALVLLRPAIWLGALLQRLC